MESPLLHSNIFGTGIPLIILHGYFGMGDNWKSIGKVLAKTHQVHLVDQRNHGRSFHSDDFSYALMCDDLKKYFKHHQITKAVVLGHSMGGKTAMEFATSCPEKVSKLIVADIAPKYYAPHHHQILTALKAVDFSKIERRNEVESFLKPYIPEMGVRQFLMKNIYRPTQNRFAFRFHLKALTEHNAAIGKALAEDGVYKGDTLFLKGEKSDYITASDAPTLQKHFPKAIIKSIEKAGHWLHAENPKGFLEVVMGFLAAK